MCAHFGVCVCVYANMYAVALFQLHIIFANSFLRSGTTMTERRREKEIKQIDNQ